MTQTSGTGDYGIEYANDTANIDVSGTYGEYPMATTDIVRIWDTYLTAGTTYYFRVRPLRGNANLSIALHKSDAGNPSTWYQSRADAVAFSNGNGPGRPIYLTYTPSTTDRYGLVVLNNGASIDTAYKIDFSDTLWPSAYLPGVLNGYPCDQYDPYESNGERYGPLLSGVTYEARLCQGDIDKFKFDVPSEGHVQVAITLPLSLKNYASIAIYKPEPDNSQIDVCGNQGLPLTKQYTTLNCTLTVTGTYRVNVYSADVAHYDAVNFYSLRLTYP